MQVRRVYRGPLAGLAAALVTAMMFAIPVNASASAAPATTGSDIAVFRPSDGNWYFRGGATVHFGWLGDIPVPADYVGDSRTDLAVFRPSTGTWYVRGGAAVHYGTRGDIPVPGDYNGDGKADIAVFRPSTGTWYIRGTGTVHYGTRGDIPVPGQYKGGGVTDEAVFRPSSGDWYERGRIGAPWGARGDIPVPGDYGRGWEFLPSPLTDLTAAAQFWTTIKLSWGLTQQRVMIRRSQGRVAPASYMAGVRVADLGAAITAYTDRNLRPSTTYSYALFTHDIFDDYSRAATVTLTTGGPATIEGTVRAASGVPLSGVTVQVHEGIYNQIFTSDTTDASGHYAIGGLSAGTPWNVQDYSVCFDARNASGGGSTTGYVSTCYDDVPWLATNIYPSFASTQVTLKQSGTKTLDATLATGGAISGTVRAATGGAGLAGVSVRVSNSVGTYSGNTGADGTYTIGRLPPGAYTVCFAAVWASGGPSTTGYRSECHGGVPWEPRDADPAPSDVPKVQVQAGLTTGVDAALADGAAISGTVTAAAGGAQLGGVYVDLFDDRGRFVTQVPGAATGAYRFGGLLAGSYTLCFNALGASGGPPQTHYASACYRNVPWNLDFVGQRPTPGSTPVAVSAGGTTTADMTLAASGVISGTVSAAAGGAKLANAWVDAYDSAGDLIGRGFSDGAGAYTINNLLPGTYTVCFATDRIPLRSSETGYAPECDSDVSWDGEGGALPPGTTPVTVSPGETSTVDAALPTGAALSGTVTARGGGAKLGSVTVAVFDSSGHRVAGGRSGTDGSYTVASLAPGDYTVCFDTINLYVTGSVPGSVTGYASACSPGVPWDHAADAPASGAAPVTVSAGATSTVSIALAAGGEIAGTVRAASGGGPVSNVYLYVYDAAGRYVANGYTGADGTYRVGSLSGGTYEVCFNGDRATGGPSKIGYAGSCYDGVPWSGNSWVPPAPHSTAVPVSPGSTATANASLSARG